MEHLPNVGGAAPLRVSYVCEEMFDGGDFIGYPAGTGWTIQEIATRNLGGRDTHHLQGFLQAWTYFGLLHTIFKSTHTNFDLLSFVESDEHGKRVGTKLSGAYILKWREWESQ